MNPPPLLESSLVDPKNSGKEKKGYDLTSSQHAGKSSLLGTGDGKIIDVLDSSPGLGVGAVVRGYSQNDQPLSHIIHLSRRREEEKLT